MHEQLTEKFKKNKKIEKFNGKSLTISGRFINIDEGNLALHIMCAFLGKPQITCSAQVHMEDKLLLDNKFEASPSGTCFSSMHSLLKQSVNIIAKNITNSTIKSLKS